MAHTKSTGNSVVFCYIEWYIYLYIYIYVYIYMNNHIYDIEVYYNVKGSY